MKIIEESKTVKLTFKCAYKELFDPIKKEQKMRFFSTLSLVVMSWTVTFFLPKVKGGRLESHIHLTCFLSLFLQTEDCMKRSL